MSRSTGSFPVSNVPSPSLPSLPAPPVTLSARQTRRRRCHRDLGWLARDTHLSKKKESAVSKSSSTKLWVQAPWHCAMACFELHSNLGGAACRTTHHMVLTGFGAPAPSVSGSQILCCGRRAAVTHRWRFRQPPSPRTPSGAPTMPAPGKRGV